MPNPAPSSIPEDEVNAMLSTLTDALFQSLQARVDLARQNYRLGQALKAATTAAAPTSDAKP